MTINSIGNGNILHGGLFFGANRWRLTDDEFWWVHRSWWKWKWSNEDLNSDRNSNAGLYSGYVQQLFHGNFPTIHHGCHVWIYFAQQYMDSYKLPHHSQAWQWNRSPHMVAELKRLLSVRSWYMTGSLSWNSSTYLNNRSRYIPVKNTYIWVGWTW